MNAPLIWIGLPAVIGVVLFLVRGFPRLTAFLGIFLSAWLSIAAWLLPIGEVITLGNRAFRIEERFSILGRDLLLMNTDRALLILVYLFLSLWAFGSLWARANKAFIPFGFVFTAILVAAQAVEPFLYAALLFEIAILLAVPFLSPPGQRPGSGIFRFLTFQSLGMPFILLAGWFLAGLEASPGESALVVRAGALIGIGLAFLLSIVPFHSWIPTLAEESEPYITAFILFMLSAIVFVFGLGFLDQFVWMRESQEVYVGLRLVGVLMVAVGGGWMAVQKNLARMLGFAAIAETGISLLAIGIGTREGYLLFFWLLAVRVFSYIPWAAAISTMKDHHKGELSLDVLWGKGHQTPLSAVTVAIGIFSLLGMPLLAGYSARFALWQSVADVSPAIALAALFGNLGLLVGGLRTLNALFIPFAGKESVFALDFDSLLEERRNALVERFFTWIIYVIWVLILMAIGFFPQIYLPWIENLLLLFERLGV